MSDLEQDVRRGYGTPERPLTRDLWAREVHDPQAPALTDRSDFLPANRNVDYSRYYDPAFAAAEEQAVWKRTWLFACRDEDLPNIGDRVSLDVGPLSFLIIRSRADEFKAFYNACRHRGTMLCTKFESGDVIRCPYHGWEWNIDGKLKKIPSHWDFPRFTRTNAGLTPVQLDRWGGFIFINADPQAPPLAEALGPIPAHFEKFDFPRRYTAARFRKLIDANWKIAQEAFMEAYHLSATHPEAAPFNGDSQTQYDIWTGTHWPVARNANATANPSVFATPDANPYSAGEMYAVAMKEWHFPDAELPKLDPAQDIRAQLGAWQRAQYEKTYGRPTDLSDAEMMDSLLYYVFPHTVFWLSDSVPFTYQFTPHATDPQKSYFDVRLMLPQPEGKPVPPSAPPVQLGADDGVFANVPEFGFLGYVFDQDMSNMPRIQRGVRTAQPHNSELGVYQEMIVQHWNELIDKSIEKYTDFRVKRPVVPGAGA